MTIVHRLSSMVIFEQTMIRTLPELARAWWTLEDRWPNTSSTQQLLQRPLAPAYRVRARGAEEERARFLARSITVLVDRLARLPRVWQEWETFDAAAYFDLYPEQVDVLLTIRETKRLVRVTAFADVLSPSFQEAETYWIEHVVPALHVAQPALFATAGKEPLDGVGETWAELLASEIGPEMERRLYKAAREIERARSLLYDWGLVDFLITSAAWEERYRVAASRNGHVDARLWERLRLVPTLTLEIAFSLVPESARLRRRALMRWHRRPWSRSRAR